MYLKTNKKLAYAIDAERKQNTQVFVHVYVYQTEHIGSEKR